ncbi:MAG: DUF5069 domain-containing protein [Lacunisphaera sp.]
MKIPGLRSDSVTVSGLVFFGRMLDKMRLRAAGTLPADYLTGAAKRTHSDSRCVRFLRVDYELLKSRVLKGGSDEEVLEWCYQQGFRPSADEIEVWNEYMAKRGWRDSSSEELAAAKTSRGYAHREDVQTWFELHTVEES